MIEIDEINKVKFQDFDLTLHMIHKSLRHFKRVRYSYSSYFLLFCNKNISSRPSKRCSHCLIIHEYFSSMVSCHKAASGARDFSHPFFTLHNPNNGYRFFDPYQQPQLFSPHSQQQQSYHHAQAGYGAPQAPPVEGNDIEKSRDLRMCLYFSS